VWRKAKILFACILTLMFSILPIYYWVAKEKLLENIDCSDPSKGSVTFFIIDVSDPYDKVDASRVVAEVKNELLKMPKGSKYVVLSPNEHDPYLPIENIGACVVPDLGESANYLISKNELTIHKQTRQNSIIKVMRKIESLFISTPLDTSPLIETLIALSKRHDFRSAGSTKIVLYSDMEQNSANRSVYHHSKVNPKAKMPQPFEKISLKGAKVEVKHIVRRTALGLEEFKRVQSMWNEWFVVSNATVTWEN
jgi:hypothetical protein